MCRMADAPARDDARALADLWRRVREALGDSVRGDVEFEVTPKGRHAVRVGEVLYFDAGGELIASRVRGGRAEYGPVRDGRVEWGASVPLAPPELN